MKYSTLALDLNITATDGYLTLEIIYSISHQITKHDSLLTLLVAWLVF